MMMMMMSMLPGFGAMHLSRAFPQLNMPGS